MVTMITMKTKYATLFSQFHYLLYLFHLPDLSLSQVFPSLLAILPSFIVLVIIVCYLHIITIKELINLDCLPYYYCHTYFIFVENLSAGIGLIFDLIYTVCKSFFRIS